MNIQKISNLETVVPLLKPHLKSYLESKDTSFKSGLFTCPNRGEHSNSDSTPSCGFVPETDDTIFHCFSCSKSGDLFTAYNLLEGKSIHGSAFHTAVRELCDTFTIPYSLKPLSEQEEKFESVQTALLSLIKFAHSNLQNPESEVARDYIKSRGWESVVDKFQFGFLPDKPEIRERINKLYSKVPHLGEYITISPAQIVDRLIYPLYDTRGILLGLMDRSIGEDTYRPKYQKYFLKTLERGEVLYNLSEVYPEVYIVEGASSIFTMYSQGIKNVVAVLGKEFTEPMYKSMVSHGIKKVVINLDGDEAGMSGIKKTIKFFENHSDIKASVKIIPELLDPDDYIRKYGADKFKQLEVKTIFKYQLDNFKECKDELIQEEYRESLFEILGNTKNNITASKLINQMCDELNLSKKSIIDDLKEHEAKKPMSEDVSMSSIITEENSLLLQIEEFEERALRAGKLLGVSTGFPILDQKLDGLQIGLALLCGKWNVGKSAFMQSIAINLLKNPDVVIGYFSIDDSVIAKTIPRFIANICNIPINTISKPIHEIEQNSTISESERAYKKQARDNAIETLKKYSGRLCIKDSIDGNDIKFVEKTIKTLRRMANTRHLVIFVDFLNMVNPLCNAERTEQESKLAKFFKEMANKYQCTIICTVEASKEILTTKISENSIKGSSSLPSMADVVILLHSSFDNTDATSKDTSQMHFDDPERSNHLGQPVLHPIVRAYISKNKWNGHRENVYFRFTHDTTVYEEASEEEQRSYAGLK